MKIIVAPDSFKGSATAAQLCTAMKQGILRVFPNAQIIELPLADGGEGTMETLIYATQGKKISVEVTGPLQRPVKASYGVLGDGRTVVIEMAEASGLTLVPESERNPMITTSYGTGELISHALDEGYRHFIVALGGSATNDGGAGMLQALGLSLEDAEGRPLPPGGAALRHLHRIDDTRLDPRLQQASFEIACDVTNPLCGPDGASAVFGPQKGATAEMVRILDEALRHYGEMVSQFRGMDVIHIPGAGAAGGMGSALCGFFQARMRSGIDLVLDKIKWKEQIPDSDLIITGEGKLDSQTLSGKVIAGVCRSAKRYHIPVIALCGKLELSGEEMNKLGLHAAFSISKGPSHIQEALDNAAQWAADQTEQLMRIWDLAYQ